MRIFGGERVKALMFRLGMTEGVPIDPASSRAASRTRRISRSAKFRRRKHLLE